MNAYELRVMKIAMASSLYCPKVGESIDIEYCIDGSDPEDLPAFVGHGRFSGEQYIVYYNQVDLKEDRFFQLTLVDIADY
jgi:hypothetical protein